jgi:hypothetical protein
MVVTRKEWGESLAGRPASFVRRFTILPRSPAMGALAVSCFVLPMAERGLSLGGSRRPAASIQANRYCSRSWRLGFSLTFLSFSVNRNILYYLAEPRSGGKRQLSG